MNITEKLLKIDRGEFAKEKTAEIEAPTLSEVLGEEMTVKVKALSGDRYTELTSRMLTEEGTLDFSQVYNVNGIIAVEGIIEPDLKDKDLQKHFGCVTPLELAKVLFPGGELTKIADKITEISGFVNDKKKKQARDEVKNL